MAIKNSGKREIIAEHLSNPLFDGTLAGCINSYGFAFPPNDCRKCLERVICKKSTNFVFSARIISLHTRVVTVATNMQDTTRVTIPFKDPSIFTRLLKYANRTNRWLAFLVDTKGYAVNFKTFEDLKEATRIDTQET